MPNAHKTFWRALSILLVLGTACGFLAAKAKHDDDAAPGVAIESWLVAGPVSHPLPAFADSGKKAVKVGDLLDESLLHHVRIRPAENGRVDWFAGNSLVWLPAGVGKQGTLKLERPAAADDATPAVAWLAVYLDAERWHKLDLVLEGSHPRRAWLDGEPVVSGGTGDEEDEVRAKLELVRGKHVLLLKTVLDPARESEWTIGAKLGVGEDESQAAVEASLDPRRDLTIHDVLDPPRITSLAIAPDGRRVATSVSRIVPGTDDSESWVEIRSTKDGALSGSWRGAAGARQVAWSPDGRYVSYLSRAAGSDDASTLFLYDLSADRVFPLLEGIEHLGGYLWSPTGGFIVFSTTRKAEKDERGVKLLEGLLDRWADYRDRQFLHLVTVPEGNRRRLTAGALSTTARDISPDGKRLLFTRRLEHLEQRPYTRTELWEMELEQFGATKLREFRWLNDAQYGPRGLRLLVGAPADEFEGVGVDLPAEKITNNYDGQLFIWDPASEEVDAITREFDPAVQSASWSPADGKVYLLAEDREYRPLFAYDPQSSRFERLDTGVDMLRALDVASDAPRAVALGNSPWRPQSLIAVDLSAAWARALEHPSGDWFDAVRTGRVETWNFTATSGQPINGRVYYPPGFDAERRYPAIVYYYGGTSPVGRDFGGRYPKEWWAANGYVVYVLQPSGATGFGQEFAAAHVNDWGKTTIQEIIEGTEEFLKAHPFVDPERVGCIGASYGGFMTMLLSTKTDRFAAAVAHAGISSLASYWGEGYWGFLYSATATADSFPWNRKDIYVEQSPLFRADQNRVPILLTHGAADTNVPVGESDAFYIALKLLGKDVEYLQIEGQNHLILDHAKRLVWSQSIVAWFDRWLKGQPEWWNALYPKGAAPDSGAAE